MSYLTDNMLRNIVDVPVALPVTRITANTWLIVATVRLEGQLSAEFNFLLMQLLDAINTDNEVLTLNDTCDPAEIGIVNANYGLAYIGIVKDLSGSSIDPASLQFIGTLDDVLTISSRGIVTRESDTALNITTPGNYSFILVNNCVDTDLRLLVSGLIRVNAS